MYMKDMIGSSISDDAEFDDLDDFDYVDQFIPKDEEKEDVLDFDEDYDDLDDLYIEDKENDDFVEEKDTYEDEDEDENEDIDEELEARFSCEDCGHKWYDYITETDDENDMFEISCPLCGSQNVTMER